jgi:hypothetical protein
LVYFKGKIAIPGNLCSQIVNHLVSQKPTSSRCWPNVSHHLATFHLAQPTHLSWKLHETLQDLPTLQGIRKEVWTHTNSGQTTNC